MASEAALFAYLLFSYYYTGATAQSGLAAGAAARALKLALPNTMLLLASSLRRLVGRARHPDASAAPGAARFRRSPSSWEPCFAVVQVHEWQRQALRPRHLELRLACTFVTTGFHMAHVLVGLAGAGGASFVWTALDYFSPRRRLTVSAGVLYWHFVDVVWLFVFTTYYLTPYLGFGR